jgi:hypothetical protein
MFPDEGFGLKYNESLAFVTTEPDGIEFKSKEISPLTSDSFPEFVQAIAENSSPDPKFVVLYPQGTQLATKASFPSTPLGWRTSVVCAFEERDTVDNRISAKMLR